MLLPGIISDHLTSQAQACKYCARYAWQPALLRRSKAVDAGASSGHTGCTAHGTRRTWVLLKAAPHQFVLDPQPDPHAAMLVACLPPDLLMNTDLVQEQATNRPSIRSTQWPAGPARRTGGPERHAEQRNQGGAAPHLHRSQKQEERQQVACFRPVCVGRAPARHSRRVEQGLSSRQDPNTPQHATSANGCLNEPGFTSLTAAGSGSGLKSLTLKLNPKPSSTTHPGRGR